MRFYPGILLRHDCAAPVGSWFSNDDRTPVYFFHRGMMPVSNFGRIPHSRKPRCWQQHDTVTGISVKAKYDVAVPAPFCRTETSPIKTQRYSYFLHIIPAFVPPCVQRTFRSPPAF